eukprot:TRINITY_DN16950_c0_g1_i1.p1 TRINITY_DN16950_c0_g1~~TRINITY_DN16950_c0_g1_i1.p1  ORF type:complete len:429 (-),score=21.89 TRINITY_DN16950_c0_g1_i1:68-1354(-)
MLVLRNIFVLCICCPCLFFILLLPLGNRSHQNDFQVGYFWALMSGFALIFSTVNFNISFGRRMPFPCATVVFLCGQAVMHVSQRFSHLFGWYVVRSVTFVSFIYMYNIWWICKTLCLRREGYMALIFHYVGMSLGALPVALTVCLFAILGGSETATSVSMTATTLGAWTVPPILLRWVGKDIWTRGAPKNRLFVKILWVVYIEASFSCLGTIVFTQNRTKLMMYTCSTTFTLVLQVLRGHKRMMRHLQSQDAIFVFRMTLLLEAFALVISRLSNMTIHLCFVGRSLLETPTNFDEIEQVFGSSAQASNHVALTFLQHRWEPADIVSGLASSVTVLCIFCVFCAILPHLWKGGTAEASTDVRRSTSPSVPMPSWIDGQSRSHVRVLQNYIIVAFNADTKSYLLACQMFVFVLLVVTTVAINVVREFLLD